MLLMPQRKKIISLIVEGLGGRDGPREPYVQKMGEESKTGEYEVPDSDFALHQACKKLCSCIEEKDAKGMAACFKEIIEICHDESEPEEM